MIQRLIQNQRFVLAALVLAIVALLRAAPAAAEPYLAVLEGYKCNVCHVNPTGAGLRNAFGLTYAKVLLPAETLDNTLDSWDGKLADRLRVGGDLRAAWTRVTAPNTASQQAFSLEQFRVYGDLTILPDRLGIYVDEQIAPNGSQNEEAYVRYGNTTDGFYVKGGQFYLPFGWRLQDQTAFVRQVTGINMTTPGPPNSMSPTVPPTRPRDPATRSPRRWFTPSRSGGWASPAHPPNQAREIGEWAACLPD
jgi:hypothetical protein